MLPPVSGALVSGLARIVMTVSEWGFGGYNGQAWASVPFYTPALKQHSVWFGLMALRG